MSHRCWVSDLEELHAKFGDLPSIVAGWPSDRREEFLRFRMAFLAEELEEMRSASSPEDVVDALVDLCVVAVGTLHAFGVDARRAWDAVHRKNMAKVPGSNPRRPNRFGLPDLIKPEGWTAPSHAGNVGCVTLAGEEVPQ